MTTADDTPASTNPIPGLLLAVVLMLAAREVAAGLGPSLLAWMGMTGGKNPLSPISVALILGLLVANTTGVHPRFQPGMKVAVKSLLKLGIILVGLKLSFYDVLKLGAVGIPLVVVTMLFALFSATWIAARLGLSDRLGVLAAASTAICGVTATMAVAPTIEAEDDEVAYTVANVTLFGMVAMLTYPYLAHWMFGGRSNAAGIFLGMAVHDTAQAMGAALAYGQLFGDEVAFQAATVTKCTRNVFLVAVVPYLAYRQAQKDPAGRSKEIRALDYFPAFVLGFLATAILRTLGDAGVASGGVAFGVVPATTWKVGLEFVGGTLVKMLLGLAMASVGLGTRLASLRGLGLRPLYLGASAAVSVGVVAAALAALAGPLVG